jgi:hypothetical protein
MPRSARSKRWCLTLNNPLPEEIEALTDLVPNGTCGYVLLGSERGECGTPHLQGYVEFSKRMTLRALKRVPGMARAHMEIAIGSSAQNRKYCTKEDSNPIEMGTPMQQVLIGF